MIIRVIVVKNEVVIVIEYSLILLKVGMVSREVKIKVGVCRLLFVLMMILLMR